MKKMSGPKIKESCRAQSRRKRESRKEPRKSLLTKTRGEKITYHRRKDGEKVDRYAVALDIGLTKTKEKGKKIVVDRGVKNSF